MPPVVRVAQYLCAADECSATWRILPMFLARHLWRAWKTVERVALPGEVPSAAPPVPERTPFPWMLATRSSRTSATPDPLPSDRRVFLVHKTPVGRAMSASAVCRVVGRAFHRAGFDGAGHGAHILRHTLAGKW
jgi:hypothetical protein